ncbi:hypothetical protein [Agromyces luteolus]|uniref:Uncharacterized protein n=1 Tax=Agromyces luteolus TaxID=88373 RepID=A0A7C9LIS2_9MICO|nr:hypothetical protein [Agromyces luteolus]MUN08735.1 hypothetical protein [Agromyces luteolus]
MTDAATRSRADAAALRASAARALAAAVDAARADFAVLPLAADVLADSLRAAAARFCADAPVSFVASARSAGAEPDSAGAGVADPVAVVPVAFAERLDGADAPFVVPDFADVDAPFAEPDFADVRFAAASDAGRFAVPDDAAGFRALVVRFAAGVTGSAAVVPVASSAAVVARAADARFAAVARVAADFAAVLLVDDFAAADLVVDAFAALERAAADFAAVARPAVVPPARPGSPRPCSDATDSPRPADTPVSVPSGVSSSGPDRETEVTTTTYQPPCPQPWTSHSEFTSWRADPRSWAEPGRRITILLRLHRNPQRHLRLSGIL